MGIESSRIAELDEEMDALVAHYRAHKHDTGGAEAELARNIDKGLGAMRRDPLFELRAPTGARRGQTDRMPVRYVCATLAMLAKKALEYGHERVFYAVFKHMLALEQQRGQRRDPVTLFMTVALDAGDKYDRANRNRVVRRLDLALQARCLHRVFTRFRGDANDPTNLYHGGARTPLINAIQAKRPELVRVLLERGADPDCASYNSVYPLIWACNAKSQDIVDMLAPYARKTLFYLTLGEPTRASLRRNMPVGTLPEERDRAVTMLAKHVVVV